MLVRGVARAFLAGAFIQEGVNALRDPAPHIVVARGPAERVRQVIGVDGHVRDRDLALAVRVHGALTVGAGLGLALGRAPRLCALVLAGLTVPLVVAHEPFSSSSVRGRGPRRAAFIRNLGSVGAALLAAMDWQGKPSIGWRVEHARAGRRSPIQAG